MLLKGQDSPKIDLGAESTIAAQRNQEKIAIEITSFITDSDISEFHAALGQYLNDIQALEDKEPDRTFHLAVPLKTYDDFFQQLVRSGAVAKSPQLTVERPLKVESLKALISQALYAH